MKHHLSSFRRSMALRVLCILILTVMCAPMAMAAAVTPGAPTLAAGGFSPLMMAGSVGILGLGLLNAAKDDGSENGGGGAKAEDETITPEAAIVSLKDGTLTMSQRLGVALKALQGIPPAEQFAKVQADLATANASLTKVNAELDLANKRITALEADVKGFEEANAALEKTNKDLQAKEQDLDKRASAQAKQITRSVGIEASKLPGAMKEGEQSQTASQVAYTAFAKERDPEKKADLFQAYKAEQAKEKKAAA